MASIISVVPHAVYPLSNAFEALQISRGKGYQEINSNRLKTYKVGRRRFTTGEFILEYIEDRKKESAATDDAA